MRRCCPRSSIHRNFDERRAAQAICQRFRKLRRKRFLFRSHHGRNRPKRTTTRKELNPSRRTRALPEVFGLAPVPGVAERQRRRRLLRGLLLTVFDAKVLSLPRKLPSVRGRGPRGRISEGFSRNPSMIKETTVFNFRPRIWQTGFVCEGQLMFLLVTLEKKGHPEEHQYEDRRPTPSSGKARTARPRMEKSVRLSETTRMRTSGSICLFGKLRR